MLVPTGENDRGMYKVTRIGVSPTFIGGKSPIKKKTPTEKVSNYTTDGDGASVVVLPLWHRSKGCRSMVPFYLG